MITLATAALRLGKSQFTLRQMCRLKLIGYYRRGRGHYSFSEQHIATYLASIEVQPAHTVPTPRPRRSAGVDREAVADLMRRAGRS